MEKTPTSFKITGEKHCLHLQLFDGGTVRFAYSEDDRVPPSTPAVAAQPLAVESRGAGNLIRTKDLCIKVDRQTLAVRITDKEGFLLSEDITVEPARPALKKKRLWETGIFGNGEKYAFLNHLGSRTSNYCSDVLFHHPLQHPQVEEMHTAIPFYIGAAPGRAYGVYFDNTHRTSFDFAGKDPGTVGFSAEGGLLDYYFLPGPSIAEVVTAYGRLTGTPPLPRRKYLGYHQSRYSYRTAGELMRVAGSLRRHKLPCDVLYLDIHYMDEYKVFTVNGERFPDFKQMIGELKEMGFAVVAIVNPGVKVEPGYRVYEEGLSRGCFVTGSGGEVYRGEVWPKPAVFPDFLREEVRRWWGELHRELLECGVDGIWNDMNEPANFSLDSGTLPDQALHRNDRGEEVLHREAHNIYGMFQVRATREALERLEPKKRPFVLTRAAFAGSQRYAALWTGDNSSIWEHLEASIPMNLNLGLSGFSLVGNDVGGYRGDCSGELLARWTQLGAFIPFFRNHSEIGRADQEPWAFGPDILKIVSKYIRLRYHFLTYIYNLMRESSLKGTPAMRPLVYHHQDDPRAYHVNDQFLLGPGLMVCPVVRPGLNHRQVYLPAGNWSDYWTGEKIKGGRFITREAPLDIIPLYVEAGTIIPYDHFGRVEQAGEAQSALTMLCYSGGKGRYRLYLDDGVTDNYLHGEYSEVEFVLDEGPGGPAVAMNRLREGYPLPEITCKII